MGIFSQLVSSQDDRLRAVTDAICKGDFGTLRFGVRRADVNVRGRYGGTYLHWAARYGHISLADRLLKKGANTQATDKNGDTPLHWAVEWDQRAMVEWLISKRADVNTGDQVNRTPLHKAKSREIAELIIKSGADINTRSKYGVTPLLDRAGSRGSHGVVQVLITNGANINDSDDHGSTALRNAVKGYCTETVKLLLENGSRLHLNRMDNEGWAPLHHARDAEVTKLLIDHGAHVSIRSESELYSGATPLHEAARLDMGGVAAALLDNGADVNARNQAGETPLHRAAWSGYTDVLRLLLAKNADINAVDKTGTTPLRRAMLSRHEVVERILREHGAKE